MCKPCRERKTLASITNHGSISLLGLLSLYLLFLTDLTFLSSLQIFLLPPPKVWLLFYDGYCVDDGDLCSNTLLSHLFLFPGFP